MHRGNSGSRLYRLLAPFAAASLGGCSDRHFWLLHPAGPVAATELHYLVIDVSILLVIILPVTLLAIWILRRFRASSHAVHDPSQTHSIRLELIVWGIPLLAVGLLAYFSVRGVLAVDPYHPGVLASRSATHGLGRSAAAPLKVDVIATDWQWLFIYPSLHIASANELVVPTHVPIHFRLTSTSVTNDFFIPQLVGQIYVMPGMRTKQAMLVQHAGRYHGLAAEFSGPGFSWMDFKVRAVNAPAFDRWAARAARAKRRMSLRAFQRFSRPTVNISDTVTEFSHVRSGLFAHVIAQAKAGKVYPTPYAFSENMHAPVFRKHAD